MSVGKIVAGVTSLVVLAVLAMNCGITFVDAGHRGVRVTTGKVDPESIPEGIQFYTPFFSKIVEMDVRTSSSIDELNIYTRDVQAAKVILQVNYNLDPMSAPRMYQTVGLDYQNKLLAPNVQGIAKNVFGKWEASELVENRDKASTAIETLLGDRLKGYGINVTGVQIQNIQYSSDFENAIEEKVKAEQQALAAKNTTATIEERAKQRLIAAEAEAKSMEIRAQALVKNPALISYEAVQKWNGTLPTMMLGSGAIPFLDISKVQDGSSK